MAQTPCRLNLTLHSLNHQNTPTRMTIILGRSVIDATAADVSEHKHRRLSSLTSLVVQAEKCAVRCVCMSVYSSIFRIRAGILEYYSSSKLLESSGILLLEYSKFSISGYNFHFWSFFSSDLHFLQNANRHFYLYLACTLIPVHPSANTPFHWPIHLPACW